MLIEEWMLFMNMQCTKLGFILFKLYVTVSMFQKLQVQDFRLSYLFCSHHQVICHNSPLQCVLNAVIVELEQTQLLTRQNAFFMHIEFFFLHLPSK